MSFYKFARTEKIVPEKPTYSEDKHVATLEAIKKYSKVEQKNLTELVVEHDINRKTRVCLTLLPEWNTNFVPYNLAKLSGTVKSAGYFCKAFDLNVKIRNDLKTYYKNDPLSYNPWDAVRDWHWEERHYWNDLHPILEPLLEKWANIVAENKPDVLGMTLYYCNEQPCIWFARRMKELLPDLLVVVGGPQTHNSGYVGNKIYDIIVNGEGEKSLLEILKSVEKKIDINYSEEIASIKVIRQPEEEKFNLNKLPRPDYSDLNFNDYDFPNGALCEISRGCIAKCTFCEETHFWKYRQRAALSTLDEIEHMYYHHGIDVFWFIDSLVNGNLNELRAFCIGVAEKGLKIHWTGYARCDGRMDLEYFKDLKAGGCELLNYGIESGSQRVLDAMDKKVTVQEMEENFENGKIVGIGAMTNWIVGFPNETCRDFEDTMTFMWRVRKLNLQVISAGPGFTIGPDTIVGQNFDKFDILPFYYYDHWIKKDMSLSIVHKMIRLKLFTMFIEHLDVDRSVVRPHRPDLKKYHYKLEFNNEQNIKEIDYDHSFHYEIIDTKKGNFSRTLVNEIWPFLRIMFRTRGGYKLHLIFDPELDEKEFGKRGSAPLNAVYDFEIDADGNWKADFKWDYRQDEYKDWSDKVWMIGHSTEIDISVDTVSPVWSLMNFTRENSNGAIRARKLAWKGTPSESQDPKNAYDKDKYKRLEKDFLIYRSLDLSFKFEWQGQGKW